MEALLTAGTLSGAPKIRACEIIEEMEEAPRGIYGGALGYLDFTGNLHQPATLELICALQEELPRFSFLGNYSER